MIETIEEKKRQKKNRSKLKKMPQKKAEKRMVPGRYVYHQAARSSVDGGSGGCFTSHGDKTQWQIPPGPTGL